MGAIRPTARDFVVGGVAILQFGFGPLSRSDANAVSISRVPPDVTLLASCRASVTGKADDDNDCSTHQCHYFARHFSLLLVKSGQSAR